MKNTDFRLLGTPQLTHAGRPVELETRKALALLAYLAATAEPQSRDALVALLWPDHGESDGRTVLRHTLYAIRKEIGAECIEGSREMVGLRRGEGVWVDAEEYRAGVEECRRHGHEEGVVCEECMLKPSLSSFLFPDCFTSGRVRFRWYRRAVLSFSPSRIIPRAKQSGRNAPPALYRGSVRCGLSAAVLPP